MTAGPIHRRSVPCWHSLKIELQKKPKIYPVRAKKPPGKKTKSGEKCKSGMRGSTDRKREKGGKGEWRDGEKGLLDGLVRIRTMKKKK